MLDVDEIYVEDLLKKFDIDLDFPIFILTRKFYDIYTKCKIKHDLEGFDYYYYELSSKDKKSKIILTPNVEGGYLFSFSPRRKAPICGEKYLYAGGHSHINYFLFSFWMMLSGPQSLNVAGKLYNIATDKNGYASLNPTLKPGTHTTCTNYKKPKLY